MPLFVGIRFGDARIFMDASHTHLMNKLHFTFADETRNGSCRLRLGRRRERYMSFTGKQSGGRIESDPSGPGQVDFSPRMQVREVSGWTCRTFEWFHVGLALNQISRDKTRSETQPPQNLDEKPCRIPAR